MVIMPIIADQFDNAQRIHEKGFGIRLNPYTCTENQLIQNIESLLNNQILLEKLKNMSEEIRSSNRLLKVAQKIENLV